MFVPVSAARRALVQRNLSILISFVLLTFCCSQQCLSRNNEDVWPLPQNLTYSWNDVYFLVNPKNFQIVDESQAKCSIIEQAIQRYSSKLMFPQDCSLLDSQFKGATLLNDTVDPSKDSKFGGYLKSLSLDLQAKDCGAKYPHQDMDESYTLIIDSQKAVISSNEVWGLLRGLETFAQLLDHVGLNQFSLPKVFIHDWPRFSFRGIMLDSSRHFLPVKSILQTLDAMELNKMNVLHWHLMDDQSFPFISQTFPELR